MTIRNILKADAKLFCEQPIFNITRADILYTQQYVFLVELETGEHHSEFGKAPLNRVDSFKTCTFWGQGCLIHWQLHLESAME